jgi:hypothetical protein
VRMELRGEITTAIMASSPLGQSVRPLASPKPTPAVDAGAADDRGKDEP